MPPKHIEINGFRFCRDERSGYYRCSTIKALAHRYAYEHFHGPIPVGHHVHHADRDRSNNAAENLVALSAEDHRQLHIREDGFDMELRSKRIWNMNRKARPAAIDWHKSQAGRAWHAQHAKDSAATMKPRAFVCEKCGSAYDAKPYGKNRFCSNKCRAAHRRATGVDDETRACAQCAKPFTVNRYRKGAAGKFCSLACSNVARAKAR